MSTPRAAIRAADRPAVPRPARPGGARRPDGHHVTPAGHHVTRRLLVETVAPGRHLVFNPLSGAVDRLDDAELARLRRLQRGEPQRLTRAQERDLRERAYLFDGPAQEEAFLEGSVAAAWDRMRTRQPEVYTVCPTLACNLACAYCFEGDSLLDKPQGVMTDAQVDAVFGAVASLRATFASGGQDRATFASGGGGGAAPPPAWIALFGGEPLLPSTRRCVARILERAAGGGFLVGATTNGVNVARFADLLAEYADILTTFQITLDGPRAVHDARRHRLGGQGTFDEVVRGIDLLLELGVDVDLRVNVDAGNLTALPELAEFALGKGWDARPGFALALAPVTHHAPAGGGSGGGCAAKAGRALSEMEMARAVMALREEHPSVARLCHLGFLRHLDHLVRVLEPDRHRGRSGTAPGPRYWYCEASTDRQFVFTPDGLIYSCSEAVGKASHAVGRFDPALELWREQAGQWIGRTILSHPRCRACAISTLCGGGCNFAAREGAAPARGDLLQVTVGRPAGGSGAAVGGPPSRAAEPFCNAAEETVRAYLRHAGAAWPDRLPDVP